MQPNCMLLFALNVVSFRAVKLMFEFKEDCKYFHFTYKVTHPSKHITSFKNCEICALISKLNISKSNSIIIYMVIVESTLSNNKFWVFQFLNWYFFWINQLPLTKKKQTNLSHRRQLNLLRCAGNGADKPTLVYHLKTLL